MRCIEGLATEARRRHAPTAKRQCRGKVAGKVVVKGAAKEAAYIERQTESAAVDTR